MAADPVSRLKAGSFPVLNRPPAAQAPTSAGRILARRESLDLSRRTWERKAYLPPGGVEATPPPDSLALGKGIFSVSVAQGKQEAAVVGNFFKKYPSRGASVAEIDRRMDKRGPLKRYPLEASDFLAPQMLRPGQAMAGSDGIMTASEVWGVIHNLQACSRSQGVHEFFGKYPCPEAGILIYSANMLALNGAYGQSEMFATLDNAIMPMDNDAKPKNALWKAYADGSSANQESGLPSVEVVENLWFRAHMEDFKVVDTPEFKAQLEDFWRAAATDKALAPMATYTKAMVGGRKEFEKALANHSSDDVAFAMGMKHFATTVGGSGSFPFLKQDVEEAWKWLKNPKAPDLDHRGLATDKAMLERSVQGIKLMGGLTGVMKRGLAQSGSSGDRLPAPFMVDLSQVLSLADLAKVNPIVLAFYKDPRNFDVKTGVDFSNNFSKFVLGTLHPFLSFMGKIPDRVKGFDGYPIEMDLYKDRDGHTHWDRSVVVDGRRMELFDAQFETEGKWLKETFNVHGKPVSLYFDVTPYQGGIKLVLIRKKSSFVMDSDITFTTVPDGKGLRTIGAYNWTYGLVHGEVEFRVTPKA